MPAVAVLGAVAAIGIAAEVGTTLAVIGAIGATIGAVGAITGSKELSIAGGVIGAVGAIGGLASSAGLFGDLGTFGSQAGSALGETAAGTTAAETASPFASAGASIDQEISQWTTYAVGGSNGALAGGPSIGDAVPTGAPQFDATAVANGQMAVPTSATVNAAPPDVTPAAATDRGLIDTPMQPDPNGGFPESVNRAFNNPGGVPIDQTTGRFSNPGGVQLDPTTEQPIQGDNAVAANPTGGVTGDAGTTPQAPPLVTGTVDPRDASIPGSYQIDKTAAATYGKAVGSVPTPDSDSTWRSLLDFAKTSTGAGLGFGLLQAGGAFISGATDALKPAQIAALQAQANANIAASNIAQQQLDNMRGGIPTASRNTPPPVTGAPTGLINQPMPASAAPAAPMPPVPVGLINQPPPGAVTGRVTA